MSMDKRMIINGAGTYYFKVHGAKDAPLFRSVFEYEYFKQLLVKEEGCELIAYVFSEYQAQWVMHCDQDWQIILDNISAHIQELHFKLWHKHQQILSEFAEVLFVEEDRYLVPLVMELHHWPVREGLVAIPEVYPWSSDALYRQTRYQQVTSNTGIASHRMLHKLAKQRVNSAVCYERMMEQCEPWSIESAQNRLYQALASDKYITRHLRIKKHELVHTVAHIKEMRQQAEALICDILGISIEQVQKNRFRRKNHQVEPLVLWLLLQSQCDIKQLTLVFDLDQVVVKGWLRSIPSIHPESLLTKIKQRWQEEFLLKDSLLLSHAG
ncbi:MAG: hypothetical protein ACI910_001475 [Oleispira sp.]|jgi:hypothetical protein